MSTTRVRWLVPVALGTCWAGGLAGAIHLPGPHCAGSFMRVDRCRVRGRGASPLTSGCRTWAQRWATPRQCQGCYQPSGNRPTA